MKKNIYLTLLTIVTIFCIVFGSIKHLGLFRFHFNIPGLNGVFSEEDAGPVLKDSQSLGAFDTVNIDCNVMGTTITYGDAYGISLDCNEKLKPEVSVKGNTLTVKQKNNTTHKKLWGDTHAKMIITIPKGTSIKELNVSQNVGELVTNDISFEDVTIKVNVGNIKLSNGTANQVSMNVATGDIKVSSCDFKNVDISSDVGDVDYISANGISDYKMECNTSIGNLKVNGAEVEKGGNLSRSYSQNGSAGSITIKSDIGDVEVK